MAGRAGRVVYGSVADDVLRHAEVPVLLVPPMLDHAWPTDRPLTVLVPLDGSDLAEAALESAGLLAEGLGARLHLLQVVQPPTYPLYGDGYVYIPFDDEAERANARQYLEEQAEKLTGRGIGASIEVAVGAPDIVIARTAAEQQADVIAMATHGRGGLARLVLGSVATGTLRRAHVPLLLSLAARARPGGATSAAGGRRRDAVTRRQGRRINPPASPSLGRPVRLAAPPASHGRR